MSDADCWGIFREREHSPGRENDDTEILRLTGKHIEARGFQVTLKTPEEVGTADPRPLGVFLMCERVGILDRLHALELLGVPHVNSPQAVLNTYRDRMSEANVPFIESRVVPTDAVDDVGPLPVWVKRADVHNTQAGDVTLASTRDGAAEALRALAARQIPKAVLQPHVEGDLVKFYGIGAGARSDGAPAWFRWFYHKEQRVVGQPAVGPFGKNLERHDDVDQADEHAYGEVGRRVAAQPRHAAADAGCRRSARAVRVRLFRHQHSGR